MSNIGIAVAGAVFGYFILSALGPIGLTGFCATWYVVAKIER